MAQAVRAYCWLILILDRGGPCNGMLFAHNKGAVNTITEHVSAFIHGGNMPILGYIAIPRSGVKQELLEELNGLQYCEAFPADNVDILILVTDTPDKESEEALQEQLKNIKTLESLSMTFGYNDELHKGERNDNEA
jgi:nitrate reductase NapAB chaperone NapD